MPHSLRAKLSGLRYKGILEDKDYKRLCKALDNEKVLEQIRTEIEELQGDTVEVADFQGNRYTYESIYKADVLAIFDKHIN